MIDETFVVSLAGIDDERRPVEPLRGVGVLVGAADVVLKERRKLILMVRETPFHLGHLRTMTSLAEMGAIVAPPIPGFYNKPESIMDLVDSSVERVMDLIGLPASDAKRWSGGK